MSRSDYLSSGIREGYLISLMMLNIGM
jgi:hypothetical protein